MSAESGVLSLRVWYTIVPGRTPSLHCARDAAHLETVRGRRGPPRRRCLHPKEASSAEDTSPVPSSRRRIRATSRTGQRKALGQKRSSSWVDGGGRGGVFVWAAFLRVSGLHAPATVPSTLHVGLGLDTGTRSHCALRTACYNDGPRVVCPPRRAPRTPAARDSCFAEGSLCFLRTCKSENPASLASDIRVLPSLCGRRITFHFLRQEE